MWKYLILFLFSSLFSCESNILKKSPPNIVFILADDLGWADLPIYGNKFNEAPNITRLAQEGMRFTNAYAACPVCSPTRASIQSGQYPARVGIIDFLPGHWRPYESHIVPQNRTQFLPSEVETLAESLKNVGYRTGYFGKWHLGHTERHFPKNQGYDESVIFQGSPYYNYNKVLQPNQDFPEDKILSEALTDLSLDFIHKNRDTSFLMFLAPYDVHVQLDADSTLIEKYMNKPKVPGYPSNAIYAAMIEHIDLSVGRIMDKLGELGIADNTLVIFFSDNGGLISRFDKVPLIAKSKQHLYEGDSLLYIASSNAPLRSEKGTVYEGGIREPLIVRWPNHITAGSLSESLVTSVDFFPTFLELADANLSSSQVLDGKSIVPSFSQKVTDTSRAIYWHYPVYHHSQPASAIRKGPWKLIHFLNDDRIELYNLETDIGESTNLADNETEKAGELKDLLVSWRNEVGAEITEPNPDFDEEKRYEWGRHPGHEQLRAGR